MKHLKSIEVEGLVYAQGTLVSGLRGAMGGTGDTDTEVSLDAASANAGGIYVKTTGGEYLGKVMGTRFMAQREATDEHKATLARIATDPSKEARDYGKESGVCSCCGRRLTLPSSIAAGIGPRCAEGWGF